MKRMRLVLITLLFSLLNPFIPIANENEIYAAPAPVAKAKKQGSIDRRAFYRGLGKRLGKERSAYPHLTDEQFANFRAVVTTGMGKGKLYRSSSPIRPWSERNVIADHAARAARVRTFVNLADTEKAMRGYAGYPGSYYSGQAIIPLNLTVKFQGEPFRKGLARGIRFMAANEAPFLIHCGLGKDRAGFVCAVLECLMGATAQEVVADYLVSFYNYFGIEPGTGEYELVADNEIRPSLARAFDVKDIESANLSAAAERYLLGIGVSSGDIAVLRRKLGPGNTDSISGGN